MVVLGWWSGNRPPQAGAGGHLSPPAPQVCLSGTPLPRPQQRAATARGPGGPHPGPRPPRRARPRGRLASQLCPPSRPPFRSLGRTPVSPRPPLNPKCGAERRFPALPLPQPPGCPLPAQRTEGKRAQSVWASWGLLLGECMEGRRRMACLEFSVSPPLQGPPSCAWWRGPAGARAGWRCGMPDAGGPCVTMAGTCATRPWSAGSWAVGGRGNRTRPLAASAGALAPSGWMT